MGRSLIEILTEPDEPPAEPVPKTLWEMSDEELAVACKTAQVKMAHEAAPVLLPTTIEGARQFGFDFLRDEFRVKVATPKSGKEVH